MSDKVVDAQYEVVEVLPAEASKVLEQLSKIKLEVTASFDLPFLKAILDYASTVRTTTDAELLKRLDAVWVQMAEDSYNIYRKILLDLKILPEQKALPVTPVVVPAMK